MVLSPTASDIFLYTFPTAARAAVCTCLAKSLTSQIHSRKLTWKPQKGPIKTTVLIKGGYMGFHVSLGECIPLGPSTNASSPPGCVFDIPLPSPPACEYMAAASFKSPSLQAKAQRQVEAKAPGAKTLSRLLSAHGPKGLGFRV